IVGHASGLMLPDIGRLRAAEGRFRALRLVHTHLFNEPLTRDDLTDLTRLRLDLVAAILLNPVGEPQRMTWAYNTPTFEGKGQPFAVAGPFPYGQPQPHFGELIAALEAEFAQHARTREVTAKDGRAILIHVGEKRKAGAANRARAWPSSKAWLAPPASTSSSASSSCASSLTHASCWAPASWRTSSPKPSI